MVEQSQDETKRGFTLWFRICPVRHVLLLLSLLTIGAYFALRGNHALMVTLSEKMVRPCHRVLGKAANLVPFSVAELIYALLVIGGLVYIIVSIVQIACMPEKRRRVYKLLITLCTAAGLFYGGFCLLWGVYYFGDSFCEKTGLDDVPVSVEQLEVVTCYFAQMANDYAVLVPRGENGAYAEDRQEILRRGAALYRNAERRFPALAGDELRPKPVLCSKIMSMIEFTGFFFPFTGEANLNMDSPAFMLPSTVAHELAHQRGVAKEQEANFAAVVASLESGDASFIYSSAVLAYIHLGNALYDADREAWARVYSTLSDTVLLDLNENREYWSKYDDTPVSKASDAVYEGFLYSYGQTLGLKSYGACVDMLVAYYEADAREAVR